MIKELTHYDEWANEESQDQEELYPQGKDGLIAQHQRDFKTVAFDVEDPPEEFMAQGEDLVHMAPIGNFSTIGVIAPRYSPRIPTKTNIKKSVIFDMMAPHCTEPAILSPSDPRNISGNSPLQRVLNKEGEATKMFPRREFRFAVADMQMELVMPKPRDMTKLLTMQDVLGGNEDVQAMNLASSPGFPWVAYRKGRGKAGLISNDGFGNYTLEPELSKYVTRGVNMLINGTRPFNWWLICLKGERRTNDRVADGNTRGFTIAPAHVTVIHRIFFIDFITAFQRNKLQSFSAIGIDPPTEWETMLRRMEEVSDAGFDGDFSCFDGKLQPECIEAAIESISDWYDDYADGLYIEVGNYRHRLKSEECRRIRRLLCDEIIHTNQIAMNCGYQKHQGIPSGCALTVILNTMVNAIYLRSAFYSITGMFKAGAFREHVRETIYGDDNMLAVSSELQPIFNFDSVAKFFAEHGIKYTPAEKTAEGVPIRPLSELGFLKRKTGWYEGRVRVPLMSRDTIHELCNWVRADVEEMEVPQLMENLRDAQDFMFFYGKLEYETFLRKLNTCLGAVGLQRVPSAFEIMDTCYRTKIA